MDYIFMLLTVRHVLESSATVHCLNGTHECPAVACAAQQSSVRSLPPSPSLCVILLLQCKVQCVVGAAGRCAMAAAGLRVGAVWVLGR